VGAGSSRGDKGCKDGIPGWWGLLEKVLEKSPYATAGAIAELKTKADPWDAADFVLRMMAEEEAQRKERFQSALWEIIRDPSHYPITKPGPPPSDRIKLIKREFLNQNTTLNAVVAFCGGITAWVRSEEESPKKLYFVCQTNPRIRAVLTTNYDPFLESASTLKYRYDLLKPVASYGSDEGNIRQIPVYHIHGYVPHPKQAKTNVERKPFVAELVLDRSSYEAAWRSDDVFGPTMGPQIHYLRNSVTLFIGFSFMDKKVNELLQKVNEACPDTRKKKHYAFVSEEEYKEHGADFYDRNGINPIQYADPKEIRDRLGELYQAGLKADQKGDEIHLPWVTANKHKPTTFPPRGTTGAEYWNTLLDARLCQTSIAKKG
jgi:hypothetical protein